MSISFATALTYTDVNLAYQITMFAMWGIGVDFPRIMMRYGRSYPQTQNFHAISMLIITLMTIMYQITWTSVYYSQAEVPELTNASLGFFVTGWILCLGVIIQAILGFVVRG